MLILGDSDSLPKAQAHPGLEELPVNFPSEFVPVSVKGKAEQTGKEVREGKEQKLRIRSFVSGGISS